MSQDQSNWLHEATGSTRHKIRLHGPWHYEPLALTELNADGTSVDLPGEVPPAGSMKIPADWSIALGDDFRGHVRFKRRFGLPSNLESHERVDLVFERLVGRAVICLNDEELGQIATADSPIRFDITSRMQRNNELQLTINQPRGDRNDAPGGIVGEVRLEIYISHQ